MKNDFKFPKWTNTLKPVLLVLPLVPLYGIFLLYFGFWPTATHVGYMPEQPVQYSHLLHAGEMGMDCRYCHNTVDQAAHAAVPPTSTCMNCHSNIATESLKLTEVRESFATGMPIEWVKIHDLPDYVYFDHSAHVNRGVSCVSCHGRVDQMEVVFQAEPLSMAWCLECHREPEKYLRPLEHVYDLDWVPDEDQVIIGQRIKDLYNINPSTECSTCHR